MEYTPQRLRAIEIPKPDNRKADSYDAESVDSLLEEVASEMEQRQGKDSDKDKALQELKARLHEAEETATAGGAEKAEEVRESVSILEKAHEVASNYVREAENISNEAEREAGTLRREAERAAEELRATTSADAETRQNIAKEEANRVLYDAKRNADDLSREARALVDNASERAQSRVDEILAVGTKNRNALADEIAQKQDELRKVDNLHKEKLEEFKELMRSTMDKTFSSTSDKDQVNDFTSPPRLELFDGTEDDEDENPGVPVL